MGFKKIVYDVDDKGLDPTKPHKCIGLDGKLAQEPNLMDTPAEENLKELVITPKETIIKKTAQVQKKESATLKSQKEIKDSDETLVATMELPSEENTSKPRAKKTTKNITKKRQTTKTTRRKVTKKEDS